MNKLLRKKLTRGGFTLAELLIVVAIIAVLIAIAVPIFTGALEKAEKATFEANQRSIKAAGAAIIMTSENFKSSNIPTSWWASATVDEHGDLGSVSVVDDKAPTGSTTYEEWKTAKETGAIVVEIKPTDLGDWTHTGA